MERRRAHSQALESLNANAANFAQELDGLSLNPKAVPRARASYDKSVLSAEEHQSLAAKLAQREVRRRDQAKRSVRQAGVLEDEEHERRTAGVWGDWEADLRRASWDEHNELSSQLQEVARLQQHGQHGQHGQSFSVCIASGECVCLKWSLII